MIKSRFPEWMGNTPRASAPWTEGEVNNLRRSFAAFEPIVQIARKHGRTVGGLRSRLESLYIDHVYVQRRRLNHFNISYRPDQEFWQLVDNEVQSLQTPNQIYENTPMKAMFGNDKIYEQLPFKPASAKEMFYGTPAVTPDNNQVTPPTKILPSFYNRLRNQWVQSSNKHVTVGVMNTFHIHRTMRLMEVSHENVVDKSSELLGKIASHFRNQPEIVELLIQAGEQIQQVESYEMYPIIHTMSNVLTHRHMAVEDNDSSLEWDAK